MQPMRLDPIRYCPNKNPVCPCKLAHSPVFPDCKFVASGVVYDAGGVVPLFVAV